MGKWGQQAAFDLLQCTNIDYYLYAMMYEQACIYCFAARGQAHEVDGNINSPAGNNRLLSKKTLFLTKKVI